MGINGLNKFVKKHARDAFIPVPIASFSGKRIAIDGNNWMYTNMATARKKVINRSDVALAEPDAFAIRREWFLMALNFIIGWLSFNVTPVFSYDGRHPPEKADTKAKRRDARVAAKVKIDALYEQLKGDILARPANIVEELRKELRNYNFIAYEDFELFKLVLKKIGIPSLQAVADGEHLCSSLCIEGKVAAVFSNDTDNLVYGCPLLITGFSDYATYDEHGYRVTHLDCVRLDRLLAGLNISHSTFVDLCIMSGCDFNTNMPKCAAHRSYKLIKQYGSIDNLPRNLNIECLKHVRCREIFQYVPSDELIVKSDDSEEPNEEDEFLQHVVDHNPLDVNKRAIATARECLELAGISGQIDRIIDVYRTVTPATDGYAINLDLATAPRYVPPPAHLARDPTGFAPRKFVLNVQRTPAVHFPLPMTPQPTEAALPQTPVKLISLKVLPSQ